MKKSFLFMNDEGFRLPKNRKDRYRLINSILSVTNNISQAAFALNISKNTVKKARDWMENGESQLPNLGRPNKITKEIKYFIIINSIFYPETSSEKVAQFITESYGISISASTIRSARHKYGFKFGPRIYVLHLDENAKYKRLLFCNWITKIPFYYKNIIFSDESWFELGPNNYYVWKYEGEIYNSISQEKVSHPPKVMIWGGIGYNFKTNLVIFSKGVNADTYIKEAIIGSNLKREADYRFNINNWCLQQDNARPHVAKLAQKKFEELQIQVLPFWPPYSPDLSPIEIIWAIMKRRVDKYKPKNIQQLSFILQSVWKDIRYYTINELIDSFPKKIQKCIQNNGAQVNYPY